MPVTYLPSAEQLMDRQKKTAKKRRRNQNVEIDELAKLLPVKPLPLAPPIVKGSSLLEDADKNQTVDKISVLRITSAFIKFQEFLKKEYVSHTESGEDNVSIPSDLMFEAMDGFLIVLDKDVTILFASESIVTHIGTTQHDVIGQNLLDIIHPDDNEIIGDNLVAKSSLPPGIINRGNDTQPRQFYIRFKSTMSPGRLQLSRFTSYTMVQVTGNLKVCPLDSGSKNGSKDTNMEVVGFVGECRLIEATSSILEISIPQSYFTTTISLDMNIVSVETQMKELIGFESEQFIGSRLRDYFHPADYTKLIPCEVMLMHTGHALSPVFRFMSANGGWVWMRMEGMLRYKPGTRERQFWEVKVKMVSQEEGRVALIEQNELYTLNSDPNQDFLNPHKDCNFLSRLADSAHSCSSDEGAAPILRSLSGASLPESVLDSVLHGREMGLSQLPRNLKRVLHHNEADSFKAKVRKQMEDGTWGKPDTPPPPPRDTVSPPLSALSPPLTDISLLSSSFLTEDEISLSNTSAGIHVSSGDLPITTPTSLPQEFCNIVPSVSNHTPSYATPIPSSSSNSQDQINAYSSPNVMCSGGVASPAYVSPGNGYTPPPPFHSANMGGVTSKPDDAVTAMFANLPLGSIPKFTSVPYQYDPHNPIPDDTSLAIHSDDLILQDCPVLPEMNDQNIGADLTQILNDLDPIPDQTNENGNGDEILEELLREADEMNSPSPVIKYYDSHSDSHSNTYSNSNSSLTHHVSGDITVSSTCQVAGSDTYMMYAGNGEEDRDILEILSQFS